MFKPINGFTKESIKAHIEKNFVCKSLTESGTSCAYRGAKGAKCAVGMFIPDEMYDPMMDRASGGYNVSHVLAEWPELKRVMPLSVEAMGRLQMIHDTGGGFGNPFASDQRSNKDV